MIKNKKNIIITIVIAILIGVLIGISLYFILDKDDNNTNINNDNNIKNELLDKEKIEEYLDINYKLSYLLTGDVKVSEASTKVGDLTYYGLDDSLLSDIKTYEDIENLFRNNYLEGEAKIFLEYLSNENYNRYISFDDKLYVLKRNKVCKEFTSKPNEYRVANMSENEVLVDGSTWGFSIYKKDGKWLMSTLNFKCQD